MSAQIWERGNQTVQHPHSTASTHTVEQAPVAKTVQNQAVSDASRWSSLTISLPPSCSWYCCSSCSGPIIAGCAHGLRRTCHRTPPTQKLSEACQHLLYGCPLYDVTQGASCTRSIRWLLDNTNVLSIGPHRDEQASVGFFLDGSKQSQCSAVQSS